MSRHKTIYIPTKLEKKLKQHPDINFSRICRDALEKVCSDPTETKDALLITELSSTQEELRSIKVAMEGIARRAAKQAGMVVLSEAEAKTFRELVGNSATIESFVQRTRRKAVEDYKEAINKKRQETLQKNKTAVKLQSVCVVCGDTDDVACGKCGAPLCWLCWTGDDPSGVAVELCPNCEHDSHL